MTNAGLIIGGIPADLLTHVLFRSRQNPGRVPVIWNVPVLHSQRGGFTLPPGSSPHSISPKFFNAECFPSARQEKDTEQCLFR